MKAYLIVSAIIVSALCWASLVNAADAIPIHVFIVWTDDRSGSIAYTEHVSTFTSADKCGALTLKEAEGHVQDFKANATKWTPHIVCGVANEHYQAAEQSDDDTPDDPEGSHPGTGGDKPSGTL